MKIVLDPNVFLAAFGTRGLCEALLAACLEGQDLVTSGHILGELRRHLLGKLHLPPRRADEVVAFVRNHAEVVEPPQVPAESCPDPDDLPVLGTAVAGRVELLVTGDGELLALGRHAGIAIVTPRECYRRLT